MAAYPGVVALDDHTVPVTIGIDDGRVTMVSGDLEIGEWTDDECVIRLDGDGQWLIEAEQESLAFLPDDPSLFALRINGVDPDHEAGVTAGDMPAQLEGSAPRAMTMAGFYVLSAVTLALGVWALISLFR